MSDITLLQVLNQLPAAPGNGLILPFASCQPQNLRRVPFAQCTLMLVLNGEKQLHRHDTTRLLPGRMLLVPAGAEITFTNQPVDGRYLAWVVPFDASDLQGLNPGPVEREVRDFAADPLLLTLMRQWLELGADFHQDADNLARRRAELVQRLRALGFAASLRSGLIRQMSTRLQQLLSRDLSRDWQLADVCQALAVSESSLRRKLDDEHTGFRELLSELRLGQGLNLLQTTHHTIQQVADACGYRSASRFSERFRERFGTSPSELRQQRDNTAAPAEPERPARCI
ncbi:helix-turn-helix transcriptional regulator [Thalassolituus sp. LLYu03]|uniref:helix-turn-helix transcriptional regulator n=1 Tax=Thalassolituus sp. LLYu03 TaxID=3421656 RepID=UPI003D2A06D5